MAKLFWKSDYSVGSAYLDSQHQNLLSIVNDFNGAVREGKGKEYTFTILNRLVHYTEEHFQDEEKLMRMGRYPSDALEEHVREHDTLTEEIFEIAEKWHSMGEETLPRISTFLEKWLLEHILDTDRKYSKYVAVVDDRFLAVK